MPKFTIHISVTNNGNTSVVAHVGASLVGATDHMEYYNTSEDITQTFSVAYFVLGLCFAQDLFACVIFLFSVVCIIILKYFKLSESEE